MAAVARFPAVEVTLSAMANDDMSHAAPARAKATSAAVILFFFAVIAAAIVYALVAR